MSVTKRSLLHRPALRNFSFVIIIPTCLLLTVIAFNQTWKWEHQKIQADFERAGQNFFSALEREIEANLETLLALKALYSTSSSITRLQFRDFVGPLLSRHPSIQALEWIPLVTDSEREKYEAAAKKDGFQNFEIAERMPEGKIIRASKRKVYFPVYFVDPYEGNSLALGFDLASNPTRLKALELSRKAGEMVASGRVTLVQEIGQQFGVLVFLPIYRENSTQVPGKNLKGFVLGVFRIGDILEKSLTYLNPEGVNVYLYDKSATEEERFLYLHKSGANKAASSISDKTDEHKPGKFFEYNKTLNLANRKWAVRYIPTPDYIAARKSWHPWGVLLGGLLLTGLLATYFMFSRKRTAELLKSNDQLRLEIDQRQRVEAEIKNLAKFPSENPNPVLRLNQEGLILYANDSSQEVLKSWGCAVGEYAPPFWRQLITDTLQHRGKRVTELNSGDKVYAFFVNPILDAGYVNLYGVDITERKQEEEELKEYQRAVEGSQDMIAVVDQSYKYRIANKSFLRYQGLDKEQVVGRSVSEVIGKDAFEGLIKGNLEACFRGDVIQYEMKRTYPDLGETNLSVSYYPIEGFSGIVNSVVAVMRDITDRKKAEEQVRQSEMKYRKLHESMMDGFVFVTMDGMIKEYNRTYLELLGYTSEEIVKMTYSDLTPEKWHDFEQKIVEEQILPRGYSDVYEKEYRKKDGTIFPIELRSFLIKDDKGSNVGMSAIIRDISERKGAEEALRRSEETAKSMAQENALMAEMGRIIGSSLNIEEVYDRFVEKVRKLISFDRISINIVDHEKESFSIPYVAGPEVGGRQRGQTIPLAGTATEEVVRTRSSLLIQKNDEKELANRLPGLDPVFASRLQSDMVIPLISKDRVIGVLNVQSVEAGIYSANDLRIAERVAQQIAGSIANGMLFKEGKRVEAALRRSEDTSQRLAGERAIIAEIGRIISSTLNIEEVYERFALEVQKLIPCDRIVANIFDTLKNVFTITYLYGFEVPGRVVGDSISLKGTANAECLRTGSSLLIQPESAEEVESEFPALQTHYQAGLKSIMIVPLISDNLVIGSLHFQAKKIKAFTEQDRKLAEAITIQVAGAIANARLFAEKELAENELRRSEQFNREVIAGAREGIVVFDRQFTYEVWNPFMETLTGIPASQALGKNAFDLFPFLLEQKVDQLLKRALAGETAQSIDIHYYVPQTGRSGLFSSIYTPHVNASGEIIGVIGLVRDVTERRQAEEALRESEQGALRLAGEKAVMAEIGRIISSTLNIEEVYERFVEEVQKLITFDRLVITIINEKDGTVSNEFVWGTPVPGRLAKESYPLAGSGHELVLRTRKSLIVHVEDEKEVAANFPALLTIFQAGFRSFMSTPLFSHDQVIGILHFRSRKAKAYTDDALKLAETIATHIGGAIANAQLFAARKQVEEALQKEKDKLQKYLDVAGVITVVIESNQRVSLINRKGCEVLGYEEREIIGANWFDTFLPKLDRDKMKAVFARLMAGEVGPGEYFENLILTKSGEEKIIGWRNTLLKDQTGTVFGTLSSGEDITYRKEAEERLRGSEEHFRSLIENSSDMIFEADQTGAISYISPSVERLLGYKAESLIGKNSLEFIHPDDLNETRETYRKLYQNPGVIQGTEYRVRHSDGSWRIFQSVRKLICKDGGNPMAIINSRDITEQKNLEGQLGRAQKLESVGQLAAGIAHEINTPTQYVGDNTRFLQGAFKDLNNLLEKYGEILKAIEEERDLQGLRKEVGEIAEKIDLPYLAAEIPKAFHETLEGVERVTRIVRAMKEFSHPGTKEKTLADINKALENTITVCRNEWKYVAEMVIDLDSSLPPVPCLLAEFNQAILNLIINAAHAIADVVGDAAKGKGTIRVSTRHEDGWAEVRISDTGSGIPENIRSRIFDPFFTTKQVGKGTGQGLAIAHDVIVKKQGGSIDFETDVGKGTTFIIRLPLGNGAKAQGK